MGKRGSHLRLIYVWRCQGNSCDHFQFTGVGIDQANVVNGLYARMGKHRQADGLKVHVHFNTAAAARSYMQAMIAAIAGFHL